MIIEFYFLTKTLSSSEPHNVLNKMIHEYKTALTGGQVFKLPSPSDGKGLDVYIYISTDIN